MKAIGYVRVSTDEQADHGVSLEAQRAKIRAHAELRDLELVAIYADEGISGKSIAGRQGIQDALEHVCACGGVLIVHSLSRMSRSVRDSLAIADRLKDHDAQFVSITENVDTTSAMGEMFFTLCAAFSQLERRMIGERTKAALAHKRETGHAWGHPPYGWRCDGETKKLIKDDDEQEVLETIRERMAFGYGWTQIARYINDQGHTTRAGTPFDRGIVRRLGVRIKKENADGE